MARYVLLDGDDKVVGVAEWDGVTPYDPPGVVTKFLLPSDAPDMKRGDTYNTLTNQVTPRPFTPDEVISQNSGVLERQVAAAVETLTTIKTQADNFQTFPPYATANLANLNDLLNKTQQLADAVGQEAVILKRVCRLIGRRVEATD